MSRKLVFVLNLFVLVSSLPHIRFNQVEVRTAAGYPVHNMDTRTNYTTIQEAINANETSNGHTIYVEAGMYYENVVVGKSITLVGEATNTTIIDGSSTGNVISLTVGNVTITGFTIRNSSYFSGCCGIYVSSSGNNISHNMIANNRNGIVLSGTTNNIIYRNNITTNNNNGIKLEGSLYNNIFGNNIVNNDYYGISLDHSSCNNVSGNNITANSYGISLDHSSSNNNVSGNNIVNNDYYGISFSCYSSNNHVYGNDITNNEYGIYFPASSTIVHNTVCGSNVINNDYGILLGSNYNEVYGNNITANYGYGIKIDASSKFNTISGNNITENKDGVFLNLCSDNSIYGNNIMKNADYGLRFEYSNNNTIYHNGIVDNTQQAYFVGFPWLYANSWDDGYPSGGNYWSDYESCHPDAEELDRSGIWNTPYVINDNNTDTCPLMVPTKPIIRVFITYGLQVETFSNSSISMFQFSSSEKQLRFNVTGPIGTTGFCKVAIPDDLLWGTFSLLVNGSLMVEDVDYTKTYNDTHCIFYITFSHSTQTIEITGTDAIPEFPSFLIMPLFMISTLVATIIYRRKHTKHT